MLTARSHCIALPIVNCVWNPRTGERGLPSWVGVRQLSRQGAWPVPRLQWVPGKTRIWGARTNMRSARIKSNHPNMWIDRYLWRYLKCSKSVLRSKPKNVSYHFEPQFSGWSLLISYHLQKNNHPHMWIGRNIWRYLKFHSCTGQGWLKCGVGSERNLWHFFGS